MSIEFRDIATASGWLAAIVQFLIGYRGTDAQFQKTIVDRLCTVERQVAECEKDRQDLRLEIVQLKKLLPLTSNTP